MAVENVEQGARRAYVDAAHGNRRQLRAGRQQRCLHHLEAGRTAGAHDQP